VVKVPVAIADILTTGSPTALDLGLVNGRHFCTVATVGVDAEISRYVDTMRMPLTGTLAYLYGAMCVLARYKPLTLHLTGDFDEIQRPIFLASCANTSTYGGAIRIAPDASPTDGFLDICVVDAVHPLRVPRLVGAILRGKHTRKPEVHILRTRQMHIDATETLAIWADGERIAETPATFSAAPQAIRVVLPDS
jgi:diacylglycerol kinase (ATP)